MITYGDGKVLGILATRTTDHDIQKRQAPDANPSNPEQSANNAGPANQANEPESAVNQTDYVYYPGDQSPYRILLYTSAPPRLYDGKGYTYLYNNVSLTITTNTRNLEQRILKVRYNFKGDRVRCK